MSDTAVAPPGRSVAGLIRSLSTPRRALERRGKRDEPFWSGETGPEIAPPNGPGDLGLPTGRSVLSEATLPKGAQKLSVVSS